ncbi:MAG TPA: nucleoside-diphosphate kinase [Candidatus Saccharimonadales bacterium]|nr:nucleoside-diphosphate kinase [Candidatus Saccharimonadales bacterium]
MERTLIILKPDAVQRGIVGEIVSRFERVGLKIIGTKMLQPDADFYHHHYEGISQMVSRRGQHAFDVTLDAMQEGPVIAIVLEGVEAVALVRKMVGTTEPKEALPGTIRGDYAHISFAHAEKRKAGIPNVVHASGNKAEAEQEIVHWFSEAELFDYETTHEHLTQGKTKK